MGCVFIDAIGIEKYAVYMAHERGNWGPEHQNSDALLCALQLNTHAGGDRLWIPCPNLVLGEEFKLLIPDFNRAAAVEVYNTRMDAGVHVGLRFDYDIKTNTMWLLANSHPVVREGEWNQNNVYTHD